ncbi:type II secretion system protein [Candidatus Wolfebacteria bacterium]|nr:type II secretion system protein [Candidatus Wolfebacteria bacterium]
MQKENTQIIRISKRGFTLLELLIVIGILAILTTVVAITLNPAQLLAQARDSQRLSDLNSVNSAVGLYVASASTTPAIGAGPTCTAGTTSGFGFGGNEACTTNASTTISGTGWVLVDFRNISSGSPLSKLPLDPVNSATYFYAYKGDTTNLTIELNTKLESNKYTGLMTTDGGSNNSFYEIGSDPGLDL